MSDLVLTTYDRVPEPPRGFVRDLRIRWALEEAALDYRVASTPFGHRDADHLARQPFGQVPWLTHAGRTIFESGAMLLYVGELSPALMPEDSEGRWRVTEWLFAALNSVEMPALPWALFHFGVPTASPEFELVANFLRVRLDRMEPVLAASEWLTGAFSIADIAMADVLRLVDRFDGLSAHPACKAYVVRATARPAFRKAYADQLAHFAAADKARG